MTALAVLLLALVVVFVAGAYFVSGERVLRSRTKRKALVTTTGGAWFAGVLTEYDRRAVVLTTATTEDANGAHVSVDGEVLILTEDVAHIQFP